MLPGSIVAIPWQLGGVDLLEVSPEDFGLPRLEGRQLGSHENTLTVRVDRCPLCYTGNNKEADIVLYTIFGVPVHGVRCSC